MRWPPRKSWSGASATSFAGSPDSPPIRESRADPSVSQPERPRRLVARVDDGEPKAGQRDRPTPGPRILLGDDQRDPEQGEHPDPVPGPLARRLAAESEQQDQDCGDGLSELHNNPLRA